MPYGSSGALTKALVLGAITCAVVGGTGCKKLLAKIKKGDAGTTAQVAADEDIDEDLQVKVDEYIKCMNSLSPAIHHSRHRYLTYIPRTGPTGREVNADLYPLPSGAAASCSSGVARAKRLPPPQEGLEAAGEKFAKAAVEIDKLVREADRYYENKDFRADKWERGKALHPQLMTAWTAFSTADQQLHDTLAGITKPLSQRVLGRIEQEEGKRFRYYRKRTLITARELVEASDPVGEDDDIDFDLYGAAYTDFETALEELQSYGTRNRSELGDRSYAPSWPVADSNYDAFVADAGKLKKAAKELWRCLRDAPEKAKTPSGKIDLERVGMCDPNKLPKGSGSAYQTADEVIKEYNRLIKTSNERQFP
jgi:hypothetical protein